MRKLRAAYTKVVVVVVVMVVGGPWREGGRDGDIKPAHMMGIWIR